MAEASEDIASWKDATAAVCTCSLGPSSVGSCLCTSTDAVTGPNVLLALTWTVCGRADLHCG